MRVARCSCGQLQCECEGEPDSVSACYCGECRRRTGSAFGIAAFYPRPAVSITGQSSRYQRLGSSGQPLEFHFCPSCGSTVYWYPAIKPDHIAVADGCFVDGSLWPPGKAAHSEQRPAWVSLELAGRVR